MRAMQGLTVSRLQPTRENKMEANPSKEPLPARESHHAWYVVGWLGAMLTVLAGSAAVVMARTHSVSVERSKRTTVAESGPRVLVTRASAAPGERRLTLPATIQCYVETPVFAKISRYLNEIPVDNGVRIRKGECPAI